MVHGSKSGWSACALVLALAVPSVALADEPMVTDRPDVANSSLTVGAYRMQAELGTDVSVADGSATVLFPTKLRLGLTDRAEVHLEGGLIGIDSETVGLADLDMGGKLTFFEGDGALAGVGMLFAVTLPLGGDAFTAGDIVVKPTLAVDLGLGEFLGLGTNVGLTLPYNTFGEDTADVTFAASLGIAPGLDALSFFVEGFGNVTFAGDFAMSTDFGALYKLNDSMQLDVYGRVGLVETDGFGVGVGFSFRP